MNSILQGLTDLTEEGMPLWSGFPLAQTSSFSIDTTFLGPTLVNLVGAIAILIVGWIIAGLVSSAVRRLLKLTNLDNRFASMVSGPTTNVGPVVETWVSAIVFWILMILAIVASLNALNLTVVSQPLNNFLNQIFAFLPKLGAAFLLVAIAWAVATLAKLIVIRTARSLGLDQRFAPPVEDSTSAQPQLLLSDTLGNALYWFVFLFFLPLILGVLDLQGPLQPVQNLLNEILAALPRILKAVIIGVVGWLIARVVRGLVTNLLAATGSDQLGAKFGLSPSKQPLSSLVGLITYILVLIPTAIAALDALNLPAVSQPATEMLNQILRAIPQIFTAVLILVAGYAIGRFVSELVTNLLSGIGFNNIFYWLGLSSAPYTSTAAATPTATEESSEVPPRNPAEIAGIVVLVGILLFATVAATNVLNIPALTSIVTGLLILLGQILAGLAIFAVGLYLANFAFTLIKGSGNSQARILAHASRISIIILVSAMALQQIGVAPSIVNLAFGLMFGAIAVSIALAFGLGGRDVAAEQLRAWLANFKSRPPQ
ncbi:hypothetical protein BST81_19030 [Leptolyngbya sp. 'hensonii']|uniref:mechanosensitive ion channel n=1 Tax=Leptolyngbya sp. 'hensonii' TaxID=1922337 RepID=UPI00094FB532|nr:mechanosensitive ion channel [Leptolyngbya sp. 'hensonii']OLP16881.1 hypothetical protein BST81_19030 [Leptolyngbya sp. 'hensonii']